MKSKYKISIITVVYNGAKTIEQTIRSVLGQSYKNIEYIIIDGMSTDGTQEVIEKYIDSIACFISEKDDGLYDAMNKGLRRVTGDIVGIINSDDWYDEKAFEKIVDRFEEKEADIVYGDLVSIFPDGQEKRNSGVPLENMWFQMAVMHPTAFVKKNIYERIGHYNTTYKISSDYDFLLKCYSQKLRFEYINEIIAFFRVGGLSSLKRQQMWEETREISMSYTDRCPDREKIMYQIEKIYRWRRFDVEIDECKGVLFKLLCNYFHTEIKTIIIWGTGSWGDRCFSVLESEGVNVLNFVDNNKERWHQKIRGIEVISPGELQDREVNILIAVREYGAEIKQQIKNMRKHELKSVCIKDLEELYCKSEGF